MGKKRKIAKHPHRESCVGASVCNVTPSSNATKDRRRSDILLRWISFELALLQRLVYRNKNQHRSSDFMASVCHSVRCMKRFMVFFERTKSNAELSSLHLNDDFNILFYRSLKSVLDTSVRISRIHAHHFHVPLIAVLLSIYSRLLFLLKRLPASFALKA